MFKCSEVFRDDGQVFKCSEVFRNDGQVFKCSEVFRDDGQVYKCSEMIDSPKLAISRSKDSDHAWISLKVKELKTFEVLLFDR